MYLCMMNIILLLIQLAGVLGQNQVSINETSNYIP